MKELAKAELQSSLLDWFETGNQTMVALLLYALYVGSPSTCCYF